MADNPVERLSRLVNGDGGMEQRVVDLDVLVSLVKNAELRDYPFTADLYEGLFSMLVPSFSWRTPQAQPDNIGIQKAEQIFWGATRFPEFDLRSATPQAQPDNIGIQKA